MKKIFKKAIVLLICTTLIASENAISVFANETVKEVIEEDAVSLSASEENYSDEMYSSEYSTEKETTIAETEEKTTDTEEDEDSEEASATETESTDTTEETEELQLQATAPSNWDPGFYGDDLPDGKTMRVNGMDAGTWPYDLYIDYLRNKPVSEIGEEAFRYNNVICQNVYLASSVRTIGARAFSQCGRMTGVIIPANSVRTIGDYAFSNSGIKSELIIPDSVSSIGEGAFMGCSGIKSLYISGSISELSDFVFAYCSGLTSVTIPSSVRTIGYYAFEGCNGLTGVTIPSTVTSIKRDAFARCSNLKEITNNSTAALTLPVIDGYTWRDKTTNEPITIISKGTAVRSDYITMKFKVNEDNTTATLVKCYGSAGRLEIPEKYGEYTVTAIADGAFSNCTGFTGELIVPENITSIGESAFAGCSGLTGITIPSTVESVGSGAFMNCSGLKAVANSASISALESDIFKGCSNLSDVTIPDTVVSIGDSAFSACSKLATITIPLQLTSIGDSAFYACGLKAVTLPDSLTEIGDSAFAACSSLKTVSIPGAVETIGENAFANCSGLTGEMIIPDSLTEIGDAPFANCSGIKRFVNNSNATLVLPVLDGLTWREKNNGVIITSIGAGTALRSDTVSIAYEVNEDGETASITGYYGESGTLDIPNTIDGYTLTAICDNAFSDAIGIYGEVIIPDSIITIGKSAFSNCSQITQITISNSVKEIGELAFSGMSGLTRITIPASVTMLGSNAIEDCLNMVYVNNHSSAILSLPDIRTWRDLSNDKAITSIAKGIAVESDYTDNPKEPEDAETGDELWVKLVSNPDSEDGLYYYTGKAIKPEVKVYNRNVELTLNKDYSYSVRKNTNAGVATIIIKGKGNYESVDYLSFAIHKKDISGDEFVADQIVLKGTGKDQKPKPVLLWNGKNVPASGYTYAYYLADEDGMPTGEPLSAICDEGDYIITLTACGNFTGTRNVKVKVTNNLKDASKLKVGKISNRQYTGGAIRPSLIVSDGSTQLLKNIHYTVSYENNVNVGTATVIISGKGDYFGTKRVTFNIVGTPISKATVDGIPKSVVYKGTDYSVEDFSELKLYIKANAKEETDQIDLTDGTDYTVSYLNNKNAGTATIIFTGIKGYSGVLKKTFKITQYVESEDTEDRLNVSVAASAKYSKGGAKPTVTVTYKNADNSVSTLVEKTDYTVSYTNNAAVNDGSDSRKLPTAKVTLKGNYKGMASGTFVIEKKNLSETTALAVDKTYANKAGAYKSVVTLTDVDGKKLTAGKDYDANVTFTLKGATESDPDTELDANSIVDAGSTIIVTISDKEGGNYTGSTTCSYRVTQAAISSANIKLDSKIYTGNKIEINPETDIILAKMGGNTDLIYGTDFKIVPGSYSNNTNKGTASVMIQGIGNYGGTKKLTFTIKAKGFGWWWR